MANPVVLSKNCLNPIAPFRSPFVPGGAGAGTGAPNAFAVLADNNDLCWISQTDSGTWEQQTNIGEVQSNNGGGVVAALNRPPSGLTFFWTDIAGCLGYTWFDSDGTVHPPQLAKNAPITQCLNVAYTPLTSNGGGQPLVYGVSSDNQLVLYAWNGSTWLAEQYQNYAPQNIDNQSAAFGGGLPYNGLALIPISQNSEGTISDWNLFCNVDGSPALMQVYGRPSGGLLPGQINVIPNPALSGGMAKPLGIVAAVNVSPPCCFYVDTKGKLMVWPSTGQHSFPQAYPVPVPDLESSSVVAGGVLAGGFTTLYTISGDQSVYSIPQIGQCFNGQMPMMGLPSQVYLAGSATNLQLLAPDTVPGDLPMLFAIDTNDALWLYEPNGQTGQFDTSIPAWTGQWAGTQVVC